LRKASDLIPFPTGNLVKQSQEVVTDYKKSTLGRIFEDGLLGFKNKFGM
jgi:hypothetical protein